MEIFYRGGNCFIFFFCYRSIENRPYFFLIRVFVHSNTSLVLFFFKYQVLIIPVKFPIKDHQNTCKVYSFLVRSARPNLTRKFNIEYS